MTIIDEKSLSLFIENAINEDIGDGDHSTLACIQKGVKGKAQLIIKQKCILAGMEVAPLVFSKLYAFMNFKKYKNDGDEVDKGDIAFEVEGEISAILSAERLVLNIMQRMSGIATVTRQYVDKIKDLKTKILDTRKTTPGMRMLEKAAVAIGGGTNHRMGLYDMIMLKDNHIDFAGGIEKAIDAANNYLIKTGKNIKIEIEARSIDDVNKIVNHGKVDIIMLDNFNIENTIKAVEIINNKFLTESSGNITLANVRDYALCGVDFISIGALTHQIKSIDMSLKAKIDD
jgi:nicotinate-nucleotide pyrophosphorylase (carboxylating)